jgi:hypothetical protein
MVNVHWSQLQPTSGASIAAGNPIDQAASQVHALNAADDTHLGLKIRIFAGIWARTPPSRDHGLGALFISRGPAKRGGRR